jgi:hypothetical protein
MHSFQVRVEDEGQMDAFIVLPEELVLSFGAGKRPPVRTTINGVDYPTRVAVYGGKYLVGIRKDVVRAANAQPGSLVDFTIELDQAPRDVEVPGDLEAALAASASARSRFDALSFTHRREYVRWITEAKRDETRRTRVEKAVRMLEQGVKTPG